ncbi:BLUF domain-containing protein [Methyloraptor flagellatus]|uniref:BLUF domain-containing protein n=1 Tax=Methyloraptor flagellatus TaxID=3162530 RepID=A0AAU7XFR2_9HYPH
MLLSRVIFYAHNNIRPNGARASDLVKVILSACTAYDAASGLSGALAFSDRYFVQGMEGERELLTRQFLKISQDERLSHLTLCHCEEIAVRRFVGWTVAFAGHNSEALDRLFLRHSVTNHLDPTRMTGEAILGLLADVTQLDSPYVQRAGGAARQSGGPGPSAGVSAAGGADVPFRPARMPHVPAEVERSPVNRSAL